MPQFIASENPLSFDSFVEAEADMVERYVALFWETKATVLWQMTQWDLKNKKYYDSSNKLIEWVF